MRVRLVVAAASCFIALAACSASRQSKPDLPAPEYERARDLPAASAAPSASAPLRDAEEGDQEPKAEKKGAERIGGGESAGTPKSEILADDMKSISGGSAVPSKPTTREEPARRTRSDKPEPAASPEAPPSPTVIPAPPAQVPAR